MQAILAENVRQLQIKVEYQESIILSLQKQKHDPSARVKSVDLETGNNVIHRTCGEILAADPSLSSDMYWIDPDGQGVGDEPIHVYCDMTAGKKGKN